MANDKIEIIVEDSEEVPTNVQKKVKVLEMPVFTDADKKNIEKMIDRLDKFISDVYSERVSINVLREELSLLRDGIKALAEKQPESLESERIVKLLRIDIKNMEDAVAALAQKVDSQPSIERLAAVLRSDMSNVENAIGGLAEKHVDSERIVNFIDRAVRSIEALAQSLADMKMEIRESFNERLGVMDNKVEEKLYALDSTISYMKGMIIDLSEKISTVQDSGVSDARVALLVENINEKFDAYMASLNNRLDNLVLQVIEPSNDTSMRLDAIRNEIEAVKNIKMGAAPNLGGLRKDIASLRRSVDSIKKMKPAKPGNDVSKKLNAIRKDLEILKSRRVRAPKIKVQRVRVQKLPTNAFEMLQQARKNIRSKRVAKKRQPDKINLMKSVGALQNRVLDLFIFSAIGTERKTVTAMKQTIPTSETKIRKRVIQLVRMGKLKRIRRGKKTVYSVV